MKYGAPEEIRTPDPQIRSLTNGSGLPLSIKDLPKRVCFDDGLKPSVTPLLPAVPKHNPPSASRRLYRRAFGDFINVWRKQ